jgi:hypothetical protein
MPLVLDMVLCGDTLRIWSDRDNWVHIVNELGEEITMRAAQWEEMVVAIRRGEWEKRS